MVGVSGQADIARFLEKLHFARKFTSGPRRIFRSFTKVWSSKETSAKFCLDRNMNYKIEWVQFMKRL